MLTGLPVPAKDIDIWNFALQADFIIVTNDEDFYEFSLSRGFPPKLILLRTGNVRTQFLSGILIDHIPEIKQLSSSADIGILEIY